MKLHLILRAGGWAAIYFAILFGVGFVLGLIRVPLLEPRLGVRVAELIEAPFMFLAIILAGRWVGRKLGIGSSGAVKLAVGALAAGLVLGADVVVGVSLLEMSVLEVFTSRDSVSGSVYYGLVAWASVAPWIMSPSRATGI